MLRFFPSWTMNFPPYSQEWNPSADRVWSESQIRLKGPI
jgi:hypothetical protein